MSETLANLQTKKIIEFITSLELKDEELSDKGFEYPKDDLEQKNKYIKYLAFINAFVRNDNVESYSTNEITLISKLYPSISESDFIEQLRYMRYKEFYGLLYVKNEDNTYSQVEELEGQRIREFNKYYNDIFKSKFDKSFILMNFDSFKKRTTQDDFFASSFFKKDADILYYNQDRLNPKEIPIFLSVFASTLEYFKLLYNNKFYSNEPFFKPFGRTLLLFMVMQNFISKTLTSILDIDMMTNYEAKNMLVSSQLDDFLTVPLVYKRKILKNLNFLIANKGTNKIFKTIINIFNLDDLKVYKYILTKDYEKSINGNILFDTPLYKFLKVDIDDYDFINNLHKIERVPIENVIKDDTLWNDETIRNMLVERDTNYINTKYISLESTTSIFRKALDLAYYINSIYEVDNYIKINNKDINCFAVSLFEISETKKFRLTDVISALEYLILKQHRMKDILPASTSATEKIFGFNNIKFKNNILYYDTVTTNFETGEEKRETKQVHLNKWAELFLSENINIYDLEITNNYGNTDYIVSFNNAYKRNLKILEIINKTLHGTTVNGKLIQPITDYRTFKELSEVKKALTISNRRYDYFKKSDGTLYSSYMSDNAYFNKQDTIELYNYLKVSPNVTEEELNDIISNKMFYLLNSLNNYVDTNDLSVFTNVPILFAADIKNNIYKLIQLFKSYTIELSDLNIFYTYDDKTMNTIFFKEHFYKRNSFVNTEVLLPHSSKLEKTKQSSNTISYDVLSLSNKRENTSNSVTSDSMDFKETFEINRTLYE